MYLLQNFLLLVVTLVWLGKSDKTPAKLLHDLKVSFSKAAASKGIPLRNVSYKSHEKTNDSSAAKVFDFIIIGAGFAGSILANRLSQNHHWTVLLLESGEDADFMTDIPALAGVHQFSKYNWGYPMEKQDNMFLGLIGNVMASPSGKGLGGSSIINYLIHSRGNKMDYDGWAEAGNEGWSYDDVLPFFKKLEASSVRFQDRDYRGDAGELPVQDIPYRTKYGDAFVDACEHLGYRYVDYNGANQTGASYLQATMKHGLRWGGERAFLRPIKTRPNLKIRTKSHVTKILIDPQEKRARGVQYVNKGVSHQVKASKEVILSAGPFNSPQLLMLSGVGPRKHLANMNITVIKDLPVGQKMYDHLFFVGLVFKLNETASFNISGPWSSSSFIQLHANGTGPLSSLNGLESVAFLKTNISSDFASPDIELLFRSVQDNTFRKVLRISDEVANVLWKPFEEQDVVEILPVLLHPRSYGRLELRSANSSDCPALQGNYLTDPDRIDIRIMIAGIREAQKIFQTQPFQKYCARPVRAPIPGCEQSESDTDDYWECAIRSLSHTLYDPVATCKMGPAKDEEAVVNNRLHVHGVRSLRVADSSVIPTPLSGHNAIPTCMIGEKAAAMIKEDWGF